LIGQLKLYYPVLFSCSLERKPEGDGKRAAERFYDCALSLQTDDDEDLNVAICEFSAGQKSKDVKIIEIKAVYLIAYSDDGLSNEQLAEKKSFLKELAEISAWPLFRDLFIHAGSQSGAELPLLPNVPKIRWVDSGPSKSKQAKS
jgi:hypothetical protein